MQICVFGDSTAWGAWDLEKGGWVNRLWLHLGETDHELYNLSISGGTTETILDRFENEAKIRGGDLLIFQTGGNDSAYRENSEQVVSEDDFRKNIQEIVDRAKKLTSKMFFVGFKNCDESKTTPVPWIDYYYTNEKIKQYNNIMREVCEASSIAFVDLFGILENSDLPDGVHPNAIGHQKIFEKVLPEIEKILEIAK